MKTNKLPQKLLWLDLEMTGLDPEKDRIIEVGVIATDFKLKELFAYEALIKAPRLALARMKKSAFYDWSSGTRQVVGTVYDMHQANGLLAKIKSEGKSPHQVENELIELVDKHFDDAVYLAGNSIHQDRRFIRRWWPKFEQKLHYRMLDVTSFKVYMQGRYGLAYRQPDNHRALEGIRGSIKELEYYSKKISG